jgi:hypothetical protein
MLKFYAIKHIKINGKIFGYMKSFAIFYIILYKKTLSLSQAIRFKINKLNITIKYPTIND